MWDKVQGRLELEPRLKAKTLFEWLQQTYEGLFPDSTRRTFERRMNQWRSLHGPGKAIFFDREHHPGRLAASDFTVCNELAEHYWVRSLSLALCAMVTSDSRSHPDCPVRLCFVNWPNPSIRAVKNIFHLRGKLP